MLLRAPRTPRETVGLFRFYTGADGLPGILRRVDFTGVTRQQIAYALFGRMPKPGELAGAEEPAAFMEHGLLSDEFQARVVPRIFAAYPEKQRLLFVHVPKCAGSDLTVNLLKRNAGVSWRLADRSWTSRPRLFMGLRQLADAVPFSDTLFLHSHVRLPQMLGEGLVRFGDPLFTVIRAPLERVISKINFIMTRLMDDPELKQPDTKDWVKHFDRAEVASLLAAERYAELAKRIMATPQLIQPDASVRFLGDGSADSAIELCARTDIEITTMRHYEAWLLERWGVSGSERVNTSKKVLRIEDLGQEERDQLEALTEQDRRFVDHVESRLATSGTLSIRGSALA